MSNDREWADNGACVNPKNAEYRPLFFSDDPADRYKAKNLCYTCDVRKDCILYALTSGEIWGIWGGRDEDEIRRTLSVDLNGNEVRRGRYPQCPYCGARTSRLEVKIIDLPEGGRWSTAKAVHCTVCDFEWRSRSSANAVTAYFNEREAKKQKRLREKANAKPARPGTGARGSSRT